MIPAYNEEETIGLVLGEVYAAIRMQLSGEYRFEVIVVDNNSSDGTAKIAGQNGAKVVFEKRRGKGRALVAGFKQARGEIIVMLDADYSHTAYELVLFLDKLKEDGVGLVVGSRFLGGSEEYNVVRTFGNLFISTLFCYLFTVKFTDIINGYKAFRRDVFDRFEYTSAEFEIEIELCSNARKLGYAITTVGSHERARAGGKMKSFAPWHGLKFIIRVFGEYIRYKIYDLRRVNQNRKINI